jgi:DNA polymerase-3 subunit beta
VSLLETIRSPAVVRALPQPKLRELADEVRERILDVVSAHKGAHFGSNLGTVELAIALHRVFSSPDRDLLLDSESPDEADAEETVEIARNENHLGFRSSSTQIFTRLIEGPYPNYEQVIPKDNDRVAVIDRQAFTSALRRMSVIASDQTHRIRLSFNAGMVKFSVQTPDLGEANDELPARYEGDPLDIGFNASYLLEILRYVPTAELRMTFKAPERAATVEPEGWNDPATYICLVMPLRLLD